MQFQPADQHISWDIRNTCKNREDVRPLVQALKVHSKHNVDTTRLANCAILANAGTDVFYVATTLPNTKMTNPVQWWTRELSKALIYDTKLLPGGSAISHVRRFTRMSQRRFMWGDCEATREDVKQASDNEDSDSLLKLMPAAAMTINKGEFEVMPALWDMVQQGRQLPALSDCAHEFFWDQTHKDRAAMYEEEVQRGNRDWHKKIPCTIWRGPCQPCNIKDVADFTMCKRYKAVWCFDCTNIYKPS